MVSMAKNYKMHKTHFGYFDDVEQGKPTFDPGLNVDCPACGRTLNAPVVTTSLMLPNDGRSYFYRMHKVCHSQLTDEEHMMFDSDIIDTVAMAQNTN